MANQLMLNHEADASCEEQLTANFVGQGKKTTFKGRDYFVAPMTLICPGVLNGSRGPLLYPSDEITKSYKSWNGIPLVVDHPIRDGQPISAREVVEDHVGFIKNSRVKDGKLQADGWFDIENLKRVNEAVWTRLESNEPIELSTGLQTSNEEVQPGTTFNGVLYSHVARNHRPDHLAVLPTARGACSLNDGCGVLVNKLLPDQRGACSLNDGCGLHVNQAGEKEVVTLSLTEADLKDATDKFVQDVVNRVKVEPVCTNCSADGECETCKVKRKKVVEPVENEEESLENTENCGGKGGTPGPCKGETVFSYANRGNKVKRGTKVRILTETSSGIPIKHPGESGAVIKHDILSGAVKIQVASGKTILEFHKHVVMNELSHDDLRTRLMNLLNERYGTQLPSVFGVMSPIGPSNLWINDVFDKDFVYQDGPEQYRLGYKTDLRSDAVTLSDEAPVRVTVKKSYVSNDQREFLKTLNCGGEGGKPGPCPLGGSSGGPADHSGPEHAHSSTYTAHANRKKLTATATVSLLAKSGVHGAGSLGGQAVLRGSSHEQHIETLKKAGYNHTIKQHNTDKDIPRRDVLEHANGSRVTLESGGDQRVTEGKVWIQASKPKKIISNQSQSSRSGLLNLVANSSDLSQGVPIMAGKLSDADRQKLVDGLITNSGFETADTWAEEDRDVLNSLTDEKLYGLAVAKQTLIDQQSVVNAVGKHVGQHKLEDLPAAVENAFKPFKKKVSKADDEEEDAADEGDDEDMETNSEPELRVPRQMTEAEFMKMAPPSIRADLEFSRATQNKEKQELIGAITANVSGDELDQAVNYLRTKPLPELRIIANVTSKPAAPEFDVNVRRSANYGGMAVPTGNRPTTNKRPGEGPKPVTINWAEISKSNAG